MKDISQCMPAYVTGDPHGNFKHISTFAWRIGDMTPDITDADIKALCVILGDTGLNYYNDESDDKRKAALSRVPYEFLCIHGNHEMRPYEAGEYELIDWHGGKAYRQERFPRLLFARDGEIYDINGMRCLAIGGAYSVDKNFRLMMGYPWFASEQPDAAEKARIEERLNAAGWCVDAVFTHTCPKKYLPQEALLQGLDQSLIDHSMEEWLDSIEDRLSYKHWYCGHFHINKNIDKLSFLFHDMMELTAGNGGSGSLSG